MQLFARLLVIALTTAHAALGCCAHHKHGASAEHATVCCDHHEHAHHADDSHATSEEQPAPEPCDEESCVFVAPVNHASLDVSTLITPLFLTSVPCPAAIAAAVRSLATVEDVLHPAGPALHLWQCVLVI
jgi:hypothetical protein